MINVAVLLTCHNRREKTLRCLATLARQQLTGICLTIYLVDDGSVDGTKDAVASQYPDVILLEGHGELYWNGGMRLCWQRALQDGADFYLWLNDDVSLVNDAIDRLVACYLYQASLHQVGAVIGTMLDPTANKPSYGGRNKKYSFHPLALSDVLIPGESAIECDYINGNLCLIPAKAQQTIGILSDRFTHSMGDFDYGLRLQAAGFSLWVAPGQFGYCTPHLIKGSVRDASIDMATRLQWTKKPNVWPPLQEWLWFVRLHGGPIRPFLQVKAILRRQLPRLWLWLNQSRPEA
ncbi:glycosyltransferase family 2 protein [Rheinheimera riviphila]|uniref:Glycosyltransferase family 2 protein n=1 Tax=Rheinheimera riviphila TaxID=1834037 RepID=A0A437QSI3_9GAMM|nr:glycosyltransferase family 2 protein [Rheinheimera riviphila]RVU37467.1 glycosyltransferase family 2 protein [Rheinheimera riviphila]